MNITKKYKIKPEKAIQSKPSYLIISTNYQLETLYHILIRNPLLVNTKDNKGETFLSYALKRKNIDIAELILTSPKLDYNFQDKNGNSYLHLAVINHLINIAKSLIEKGININLQNNEGNTAMHFAFSTGVGELINLLIENKIDFSIKNNKGLIGEEIKEGTFQEILDISNNNLNKNGNKINDSYTSENKNNPEEININSNNENQNSNITTSNEIILNEKCQTNKSIKIDWENTDNNIDIKKTSINLSNTLNNTNKSGSQQNSKLKFSLVNLSYSEEPEEEQKLNQEKEKIPENKLNIQSSDIFDLCSSATYQEKLANMNIIHTVGEPKIIIKKESSELNANDDIVNININKIEINQNNSININNLFPNGIQLSQNSFQTSYEKGRKKIINENKLNNNKNDVKTNENNRKGGKIIMDFCKSLTNNDIFQNKFQYNKKESDIISNNDNNVQYKIEANDNFIFSPFTSLKKEINNQINGSEINIDDSNKNSNNFSNININNEIKEKENTNIKKNKTLNISSPNFTKYDAIKENNIEIISQKSQTIKERDSNILNIDDFNLSITNIDNSIPNKLEKINFDCPIHSSDETDVSSPAIKPNKDPLNLFLSEIQLEKYYSLMKNNGFDDIQLLLNQTKNDIAITDKQLKLSGLNIPGDRAKILIRLQEKAGNFSFPIPQEVYHIYQSDNYNEDKNIIKLKNWLDELKIGIYLENFMKNGYHSLELMMLQMESKNPLTDEILKEEIGIDKIGHRSRIINKLINDAKNTYKKWKNSVLIMGADLTRKICDCNIF